MSCFKGSAMKILRVLVPIAAILAAGPSFAEGDAAAGKKVYNKCKACHALEAGKKKIGPSLHGIFGRTAGSVEGYKYSSAMKDSGVVWTEENIAAYMEKPKEFIAGNKMAFPGLKKEQQRADLIAYLKEATQ